MPRSALSVTVGEGWSDIGSRRKTKRAAISAAPCSTDERKLLGAHQPAAAGAPDIDADEQEQPDHVDEVPIPGGEFEAEGLGRGELAGIGAQQAHDQENGADQHVDTVRSEDYTSEL